MQILTWKEKVKVSTLAYMHSSITNPASIGSLVDLTDDTEDVTDSIPAKRRRCSAWKRVKGKIIKYTSCESLWMGDTLADFTSLIKGNETAHEASIEQKKQLEIAMSALEELAQIDMALSALKELKRLNGEIVCALKEQKPRLLTREDYLSKLVCEDTKMTRQIKRL